MFVTKQTAWKSVENSQSHKPGGGIYVYMSMAANSL